MPSLPLFPSLPGLAWGLSRDVRFKSRIQRSVAGRRSALLDQPSPIRHWTLSYEFLRDGNDNRGAGPGTGYAELETLQGFFLAQQGAFGQFLFDDPADDAVTGQSIGTGDGATTQFQLVRTMGGFNEPIYAPNTVSAVFVNGAALTGSAWSVNSATGIVTFTTAPALNAALSASFTYWWRCAFSEDQMSFKNFLYQLHSAAGVKFESLLP